MDYVKSFNLDIFLSKKDVVVLYDVLVQDCCLNTMPENVY